MGKRTNTAREHEKQVLVRPVFCSYRILAFKTEGPKAIT